MAGLTTPLPTPKIGWTIILSDDKLRNFALYVFEELDKRGVLASLVPYIFSLRSGDVRALKDDPRFSLAGVFHDATKIPRDTRRWHGAPFSIGGTSYYLSNQWADDGKASNLQIEELAKMISSIFPNLLVATDGTLYYLLEH